MVSLAFQRTRIVPSDTTQREPTSSCTIVVLRMKRSTSNTFAYCSMPSMRYFLLLALFSRMFSVKMEKSGVSCSMFG